MCYFSERECNVTIIGKYTDIFGDIYAHSRRTLRYQATKCEVDCENYDVDDEDLDELDALILRCSRALADLDADEKIERHDLRQKLKDLSRCRRAVLSKARSEVRPVTECLLGLHILMIPLRSIAMKSMIFQVNFPSSQVLPMTSS